MQNQIETDCLICFPSKNNYKKTSILILKLKKIVENQKKKSLKLISLPSEQYFKQLVDYLKLELSQNQKILHECPHKNLKTYIAKKLEISLDQLYCLSEHVYNSLFKRKFQLQLIEKIAKNIHQQVFQTKKTQNKSETFKKPKNVKSKTSLQLQVQTIHSIPSQKGQQIKTSHESEQFSKKMEFSNQQNFVKFQDSLGFSTLNYNPQINSLYNMFYGNQFQSPGFGYSPQNIQMLISSGYFVPNNQSTNM